MDLELETPKVLQGSILCALGYLCIALMSTCAKGLPKDFPVTITIFFQNLISLFLCFIFVILPTLKRDGIKYLKSERIGVHLVRDICGVLTFATLFLSFKFIPLLGGVLLQNSAPLWVPFVVMLWIKTKMPARVWLGSIVGFIGIILILKPGADMFHPGVLLGIASGIFLAISLVAIRRLSYTEPTNRILFYYFLFGTIVTIPFLFFQWTMPNKTEWLLLIAIGIFMYLAQFLITLSMKFGKASTLAPISYSAVFWAGILGWLIWGEIPSILTLIGMVLVIGGGIYTVLMERKHSHVKP